MSKIPKPPKGGAGPVPRGRRAIPRRPGNPSSPVEAKITADMLIEDRGKYADLMYKPNQVKSPEGMEVNDKFLDQLELLKSLSEITVESDVLNLYNTVYTGHETYEECMRISKDNMIMVLLECLSTATRFSDPDDPYDKGFLNILRIIASLCGGNPYARDRICWFMWSIAKHISPSCYFPLTLDLYYDPRLWHRPGQFQRPPLEIPQTYTFNGVNQELGPEDDIWNCELPDTGQGK